MRDSIFYPEGKQYLLTDNGVGRMDFIYKQIGGHPRDINIVALYRTRNGNQMILQKEYRLPSDRLSY